MPNTFFMDCKPINIIVHEIVSDIIRVNLFAFMRCHCDIDKITVSFCLDNLIINYLINK